MTRLLTSLLISALLLVLLLLLYADDIVPEIAAAPTDRGYDHVVYIGDSILRYQMLGFLYQIHHRQSPPGNITFNEGRSSAVDAQDRAIVSKMIGWNNYFHWSTDVFDGHMQCDCFRAPVLGKTKEIFENRFYSHPNGKFHATYFLKYGDGSGDEQFYDVASSFKY
jgi:hypothetical protein